MLKHILTQSAFFMVNKKIAKELSSIDAALLLSYFISKQDYHETRNELIFSTKLEKYVFFATAEDIENETMLSYKQQKRCIDILLAHKVISSVLMGTPARLHFCINDKTCIELLENQVLPKGENLNCQKVKTLNNNRDIRLEDNNVVQTKNENSNNKPLKENEKGNTETTTFERKEKEKSERQKKEKESNRPAEPKRTDNATAKDNGVNVTPQFVLESRQEFINAAKPNKEPQMYGTTAEAAEAEAERILAKQKDFVKSNLSRGIKLHPDKLHSLFVFWLQMQSEPFNNDAHVWNAFNSAIQKNAISIQQSIQMLNRKDKDAQSESEKPLNIPVNNEYLQRFNFR